MAGGKTTCHKDFFWTQKKLPLLFYPSPACGLNELTALRSHPPPFRREEMWRTHPARPITAPRRRVSSSLLRPHGPLSCLSRLAVLASPPSPLLHWRQSHSFARSLQGALQLSRSSNHEPADISVWSSKVIPPPPTPKKNKKIPDAERQLQCQVVKLLNSQCC